MAKERSLYWDTLKGFLIILVVFGHCGTAVGDNLLSVVYIFHLPLFVLISGYFSKKTDTINWNSYKRLFFIYLFFDVAYLMLDVSSTGFSLRRFLIPSFALWYILCLIFWRLALHYIPKKILEKKWGVLFISIVISIVAGFIPVNTELSFQRAFAYWPFFIAGYYIRQSDSIDYIRNMNKCIAAFAFISMSIITYCFVPVMYSNHFFTDLPIHVLVRMEQICIASIMCVSLLIMGREKLPILTEIGKYTLIIYLLHPPIVKVLKVVCEKVGYHPDVFASIGITIITIIIICSIKNLKVFRYLK